MKTLKALLLSLFLMCLMLTSCKGNNTENMTPAEISEKAMDNFLAKIENGNYTIDAPDYLKTSVYSKDLVWLDYVEDIYTDLTFMSINGETFKAALNEDSLGEIQFEGEGSAIEAAGSRVLNGLLDESLSGGNIYNLFYNQTEEPLTFVSYDDGLKEYVLSLAGYGENAMRLMEEVYLEMDDIDPKTVHIKAIVNDDAVARISYGDIDLTVTLGEAQDNEIAEEWMKAPEYPQARTAWDEIDKFIFNSVFITTEGDKIMPFPEFASYAFKMDTENFVMDDEVYIRDHHASQEDLASYVALLLKEGFSAVKEKDDEGNEKTFYRRPLREEYACYTSVELAYDDGVEIVARKYYDDPTYASLSAVNERISGLGYEVLPSSDNVIDVKAIDRANDLTESWLYFFTYDSDLYVDMKFEDREKMQEYLDAYEESLLNAGFHVMDQSEEETQVLESGKGATTFRYQFSGEDVVTLLYKAEKYISPEEAQALITDAGFPYIDLKEPITCRDLTRFEKARYGLDLKSFVALSQHYDSVEEAEAFLDAYEAVLNEKGYERVDPNEVGSLKSVAIYNEEEGRSVGIDFFEQEDGVLVNFDFRAD